MKARCLATAVALTAVLCRSISAAEGTPLPWTYFGDGDPGVDAVSSPTIPAESGRFLGFKDKESFHRFSGWMSGGLLLASGVVGAVHAYEMMKVSHDYRDSNGVGYGSALCLAEIRRAYDDPEQQALRWTHVGLLAAGEVFYTANAVTGVDFMGALPPGWSKAKIHRYAFFAHAGMMVAEGILGFLSTDALQRQDHGDFVRLLAAHAGIGIAIPLTILGAGAIMGPAKGP